MRPHGDESITSQSSNTQTTVVSLSVKVKFSVMASFGEEDKKKKKKNPACGKRGQIVFAQLITGNRLKTHKHSKGLTMRT